MVIHVPYLIETLYITTCMYYLLKNRSSLIQSYAKGPSRFGKILKILSGYHAYLYTVHALRHLLSGPKPLGTNVSAYQTGLVYLKL